jgi:hypothetical protein
MKTYQANTKYSESQIGDKITYTRNYKFGKTEEITSTIIAIKKTKYFWIILTEEGSEFSVPASA